MKLFKPLIITLTVFICNVLLSFSTPKVYAQKLTTKVKESAKPAKTFSVTTHKTATSQITPQATVKPQITTMPLVPYTECPAMCDR